MERKGNMKKIKLLPLILACVLVLSMLVGCGDKPVSSESTASDSTSITVTDMTGRTVTLDGPATRIVAVTPSDCEILYAIGAGDTIVGRGKYCDYPSEVTSLPAVQSGANLNAEEIIALAPQVVVMSTMALNEEQSAALENAGIKVVISDAQDIEGVYTAITLLGQVVGKNTEAANLISDMKSSFSEISQGIENTGKTVYFEVSPLEYGLWSAGKNTFMDEIATMLGLTNLFADVDGWSEVSQEQIIERNPDYIVTITMYYGEGPRPEEEIMGRKGWENISAVKNKQVYNADSNAVSRPGPRLVNAARELHDFVYGSTAE